MKSTAMILAMLGLTLTVGALPGAAQAKRSLILKAPFSFMVEQQKMPAGSYQILVEHGWLQIRSEDSKNAAVVLTLPVAGKTPESVGQVVFNHYGDQYFLSQVWLPDMQAGRQTLESRQEKELEKMEKLEAVVIKLSGKAGQ
ncbi:MAG TPA: hypothetical protein VMH48_04025 [Methylomirabilota bacterium]|nr:hypothetical protein [Methylomirabilota bacterium]